MSEVEVLYPLKGHYLALGLLVLFLFTFVAGSTYIAYDLVSQHGQDAPSVFAGIIIVLLVIVPVYSRTGRYVLIDKREGISRPMLVRLAKPRLMPLEKIQWYTKIYSVLDREKIVGVSIQVYGKKINYSDRKTPGCSEKILRLLAENHVPEEVPDRPLLG